MISTSQYKLLFHCSATEVRPALGLLAQPNTSSLTRPKVNVKNYQVSPSWKDINRNRLWCICSGPDGFALAEFVSRIPVQSGHTAICYSLQIHTEEHGSGGQAGAEPSASPESGGCSAEGQPTWVNSLVGRIFWDFLREKYWTDQVAHKIQKKLSKIKVRLNEETRLCVFTLTFTFMPSLTAS